MVQIYPKHLWRGSAFLLVLPLIIEMIQFIEKLIIALQTDDAHCSKSVKVRTQISEANAVEILGPRVQMPMSLQEFFRKNGLTLA